jgi:hypothetical protein
MIAKTAREMLAVGTSDPHVAGPRGDEKKGKKAWERIRSLGRPKCRFLLPTVPQALFYFSCVSPG